MSSPFCYTCLHHPLYDDCMPKGPLIQDRKKRDIAVAIAMGLVLVAGVGCAWLITGAGLG